MSRQLISLSPDLQRLVDEGYDVSIEGGYLILRDVPYLDARRRVRRGALVSWLDLAGDRTVPPRDHTAYLAGSMPHTADGRSLSRMAHARFRRDLGHGIVVEHMLCSRPFDGEFPDFHAKMVTFVEQISAHAKMVEPDVTARTGQVMLPERERSCFAYLDTGSARHGIGAFTSRLEGLSVAIVGLGGTGSYILDQIAKCPVARIHLFDDDRFDQHNAFRSPGAPSLDDLRARPTKVGRLASIYSRMHTGIIGHEEAKLGPNNVHLLDHVDFVFVAIDVGVSRRIIVEQIERRGLPFIDTGIGLEATDKGLTGAVRVTTSTAHMRKHVRDSARIPMAAAGEHIYGSTAQVSDMNMLAAALAVIRFKKHFGFYLDLEREHHSVFQMDGAHLINDDRSGEGL